MSEGNPFQKLSGFLRRSDRPEQPPYKARATTQSWMLPAFFLIFAVLVIPMLWLAIARWLGIVGAVSTDPLGLLAMIGSAMGAIFTVGGMVIALVAVLTQLTLQDRAERVLEDKYKTDLLPELHKLMERRIKAAFQWNEAKQILQEPVRPLTYSGMEQQLPAQGLPYRWTEADIYARQAITLYPDLPDVRKHMGLDLGMGAAEYFLAVQQISNPLSGRDSYWKHVAKPELLLEKAIGWLEDALHRGEDTNGSVAAHLALLYGARGDFDVMLETIQHAIKADEDIRDSLHHPRHLPLLAAPCRGNTEQIKRVGRVLKKDLPVPKREVQDSMTSFAKREDSDTTLEWWVVGQHSSVLAPTALTIIRTDHDGSVHLYAQYHMHGDRHYIPPKENGQTDLPPEELCQRLCERFLFLCPFI